MYNRYIRNDHGTYTRVQEEDRPVSDSREARPPLAPENGTVPPESSPPDSQNQTAERSSDGAERPSGGGSGEGTGRVSGGGSGDSLRQMLARFRLENVDAGDLILLMLLFLLFQENADEEVLAALGLLLIL